MSISMIVCSCNAIREDELREAARGGAKCAESAYRSLGCEFECGSCEEFAQEVVAEEHRNLAGGKILRFAKVA